LSKRFPDKPTAADLPAINEFIIGFLKDKGMPDNELNEVREKLSEVTTVEQLSMVISMMTAQMDGKASVFDLLMMEVGMMFAADGQKPEESEL
jgi:hypothetical protein